MHLDYSGITQGFVKSGKPLDAVSSLRVMLIMRTRKLQMSSSYAPDQILNNKMRAYQFVDLLGIRRPKVFTSTATLSDIPFSERIVIKPYSGSSSKGVYIVFDSNAIYKVKTSERLSGWNALRESLANEIATGAIKQDRWIVEEFVCEEDAQMTPARDLKFYAFYGRIGLVLEVIRYPKTRYCFWTGEGTRTDAGAYSGKLFDGAGFDPGTLVMAEKLSSEMPTPFCRIDFLRTGSQTYFCEFTPRPGGAWLYDERTDRLLGDYYLDAEGRLLSDLLAGRTFDVFSAVRNAVIKKSRFR
jgi:hypothetical protein